MSIRKPAHSARPRSRADTGKASSTLTRERIAHDLAAFRKAGGTIEVLGNTPVFTRIATPGTDSKSRRSA